MLNFDQDFELILLHGFSLVTIKIIYSMPDYTNLVQEFIWQTIDLKPKYPRVRGFLDHWETNLDGKIKKVLIFDNDSYDGTGFSKISEIYSL